MPDQPQNRIQVDLQLMASENARILQQFSETFPKAVNSLTTILGRFLDQMQSAANTVGRATAGQGGDAGGGKNIRIGGGGHKDVGGDYPQTIQDQRDKGKNPYPFAYIAKRPKEPNRNPFGNVNENEAEFLNMPRFGQMTLQDRMKQLSMFLSDKAGYQGELDASGLPIYDHPRRMNLSSKVGYAADQMGSIQGAALTARNAIMAARNQVTTPVALGVQGGMSRTGPFFHLSMGSPAFYSGMQMRAQSLTDSWGGFDPSFSKGQAQDAMRTAAAYGYVGGRGVDVQHWLKGVMVNTQLPASTIMQLADPGLRYGSMGKGDLNDIFSSLQNAAYSSGIALDALTSQVISASQSLRQLSGGTVGNEAAGAAAFTQATGLAPSYLQGMASSKLNQWMAYGAAGSPANFMTASGPQQAIYLLRGQQQMLGLGTIAHQQALLRNPRTKMAFEKRLANLQLMGLIPNWSDYVNQVAHYGGAVNSLQAHNMLLQDSATLRMTGHLSQNSIEAVARKMHVSKSQVGGGTQADQLSRLQAIMKQKDAARATQAKSTVTVALDPWAKKLLHIQNPDAISNRNVSDASQIANYAMTFGSGATQGAEAGAVIGGTIGTIVPGAGTVSGAAVGGAVGGLVGGIGAVAGL